MPSRAAPAAPAAGAAIVATAQVLIMNSANMPAPCARAHCVVPGNAATRSRVEAPARAVPALGRAASRRGSRLVSR
jgi:hypothetical protein